MADDQELEIGDDEEKKKSPLKLIIIVVVVLALAGAGAFFLLGGDDEASESAEAEEPVKLPAIYVGVPERITANIPSKRRSRIAQLQVSLMVRGEPSEEAVEAHMPLIKARLLSLLTEQNADELMTKEGKLKFQEEATKVAQAAMTEQTDEPHIEKVLFISFLIQ